LRWLELSIETSGEYAETLAHLFAKHGDGRVIVEQPGGYNPDEGETPPLDAPVVVRGWLPVDATTQTRKAMIDVGIRLISHLHALPPLQEREVSDEAWNKQDFGPVRIGRRLVIMPPGTEFDRRPDDVIIPLEPGVAFGTGHHPTTRMCLAAVERLVRPGDAVLDVGTGSGILAIAALKLGAGRALCLDIEEPAVAAARENIRRAGVAGKARVEHGSVPSSLAPDGSFNLTLANISANVITSLAGHLLRTLRPDGRLVASGVLADRRAEVEEALVRAGGRLVSVEQSGEWLAFESCRDHGGAPVR
jgi:ribosomal protein L11 methyltransferase